MTLQPDSSIPLYMQIKNLLLEQINNGSYSPDSRLPSERELADRYSVSRMTARQALQALSSDGLTYSRVGKGTYVRPSRISQELHTLTGFSEDMRQRGLTPSSRVQIAEIRKADRDVATHLNITPGVEIVVLSRIRLADGKPLALETSHLIRQYCTDILDIVDFTQVSLYETLRTEYGIQLAWADQSIQARLPTKPECHILEIDTHTPILNIVRVTYTTERTPLEFVRSVYRGDRYQLHTILHLNDQPLT